jgi:hypothetical protein
MTEVWGRWELWVIHISMNVLALEPLGGGAGLGEADVLALASPSLIAVEDMSESMITGLTGENGTFFEDSVNYSGVILAAKYRGVAYTSTIQTYADTCSRSTRIENSPQVNSDSMTIGHYIHTGEMLMDVTVDLGKYNTMTGTYRWYLCTTSSMSDTGASYNLMGTAEMVLSSDVTNLKVPAVTSDLYLSCTDISDYKYLSFVFFYPTSYTSVPYITLNAKVSVDITVHTVHMHYL